MVELPSAKIKLVYDDVTEAALKLVLRQELWSEARSMGKEHGEYLSSGDKAADQKCFVQLYLTCNSRSPILQSWIGGVNVLSSGFVGMLQIVAWSCELLDGETVGLRRSQRTRHALQCFIPFFRNSTYAVCYE